jgi:hypothetical protein
MANTCKNQRGNKTCPDLEKNNPFFSKVGSVCMFCENNIAEICDKYRKV